MSNGGQLRKRALRARGQPASPTEKYAVCVDGLLQVINAVAQQGDKITQTQLANIALSTLDKVGLYLQKKEVKDVRTDQTTT